MTSTLAPTPAELRPSWRGWMHTVAFVVAIPATVLLILAGHRASERVAASIYGAGLILGFGTSAAYHRLARSERAVRIMQRMDHSTIFLIIAGTYTPVCLLGMPKAWGIPMLAVTGVGAVLGILLKQFAFDRFLVLQYALYPILGWAAVVATPALIRGMTHLELMLLIAGGVLYTVGFPVIMWERPNPWPRTFGYHEIWHSFTVAAGMCHFAVVGLLIH